MFGNRKSLSLPVAGAIALTLIITALPATAQAASPQKALYVYDEVNEQSEPYIADFRAALAASGVAYDEVTATALATGASGVDLASYDRIIVHAMVMAFASKSPTRDWLKKEPDLSGKKVSLFVTANRWFLDKLFGQLTGLAKKDGAELVDAVSMATKNTSSAEEQAAVQAQVARFAAY